MAEGKAFKGVGAVPKNTHFQVTAIRCFAGCDAKSKLSPYNVNDLHKGAGDLSDHLVPNCLGLYMS